MILDEKALTVDDVLLTPQLGILKSRTHAILHPYIYSAPMDTVTGYNLASAMLKNGEIPVVCRNIPEDEYLRCLIEFHNTTAFFAVGITDLEKKRFLEMLSQVAQALDLDKFNLNIAIDVAHGDSVAAYEAILFFKEQGICKNIMSGSIATPEAATRAVAAGCTHLRVGIGPGSVCTTRIMTGFGVPQLTAVYFIARLWDKSKTNQYPKPIIIADGGIRYPGDANKYLAAGADAIMIGSLLSKTTESCGWDLETNTKSYRGHASAAFQTDTKGKSNSCPEGLSTNSFSPSTTVEKVINNFRGGLASAISYAGLENMKDFNYHNVYFIEITPSALMESHAHNPAV